VKMSISPGTGFNLFKLFITGGRLTVKQTEMFCPSVHRKRHAHNMAGMSLILFCIDGFCDGILRIEHCEIGILIKVYKRMSLVAGIGFLLGIRGEDHGLAFSFDTITIRRTGAGAQYAKCRTLQFQFDPPTGPWGCRQLVGSSSPVPPPAPYCASAGCRSFRSVHRVCSRIRVPHLPPLYNISPHRYPLDGFV